MQETLFGKAFDTVKVLRKARPECNVFNDGFEEPLHVAAQRRHLNIFRLLLETHAEVTADIEPLRIVAGTGNMDTAGILVARGASVILSRHETLWMRLPTKDMHMLCGTCWELVRTKTVMKATMTAGNY